MYQTLWIRKLTSIYVASIDNKVDVFYIYVLLTRNYYESGGWGGGGGGVGWGVGVGQYSVNLLSFQI